MKGSLDNMLSEEELKNLKELAKNAKTVEEAYAIMFELLENDVPDKDIAEIVNEIHLPKEELDSMELKR